MANHIMASEGDTVTLGLHIVANGEGILDQNPTVEVRRIRDGRYFDFSASSDPFWKTSGGSKEGALTGKTWLPGMYSRKWNQGEYDDGPEEYLAIYRNVGEYPVEAIEWLHFRRSETESLLKADLGEYLGDPGTVADVLAVTQGMVQSNMILDQTVHNVEGILISARMRLFRTPGQVPIHGGGDETDGLIATFAVSAVTESEDPALVKTYRVRRLL